MSAAADPTRREAARSALALGGAAAAAGAIPALGRATRAIAQAGGDAAIVEGLVQLEQSASVAYRSLAGGDLLDAEVAKAAELFAEQSNEHAEALIAALEDLGGTAPQPPRAADVDGLADLDSQSAALEFLIGLENETVAAYDDAAAGLEASDLLKTGAQIVANAGQHLAVLRQQLGADPVPDAFEAGETEPS